MLCSESIKQKESQNSRIKIMFAHPMDVSPPSTPKEVYQFSSKEKEFLFEQGGDLNQQASNYSNRLHQFRQNFELEIPTRYSNKTARNWRDVEISPVSVNCKSHSPNKLSIFGQRKRAQTICQKVLDKYSHRRQ